MGYQLVLPSRPFLALASGFVLLATALLHAGPLNPPPGPVASTHKTLTEVEPRIAINATNTPGDADSLYKITQPGSYYLTGNITGVVGKHGIEIATSGVTLDLNGFDLVGLSGMGTFDGISTTVLQLTDIRISNGTVRNWGGDGIDLTINESFNDNISDVCTTGNAGNGIVIGINSVLTRCTSRSNGINGFSVGAGTTVINNTSRNNGAAGIRCDFGQNIIADCIVTFNAADGIRAASESIIRKNTCSRNGISDGAGINALGSDSRIEDNNCTGADRGIQVASSGNIIIRNTCSGNTTDWFIAANNVFGTIVDRRAPASGIVNGFAATGSLGSTDPNANFSY